MTMRARHGLMVIVALVVLALVAAGLTTSAMLATQQQLRSVSQERDAQLRAMLMAGAAILQQRLASATDAKVPLALPAILDDAASLQVESTAVEADKTTMVLTARLGKHSMSEEMVFDKTSGAYVLERVELLR